MTRRIVFVLMIGFMVIATSCQFKAKNVIWNIAEVDGEWIEFISNNGTNIKPWEPFYDLRQKTALPGKFTEIEFAKNGNLVVGLIFELENPLYSQGIPAFFNMKSNTLKSCPDAPLFWDFSIHTISESSVQIIGDTFDGLILFDIKSCQTLKVIQEKEQLRSLSGLSWNAEKELLTYSRSNDDGVSEIISIDLDGTHREVIGQGSYPSWSPDGVQIAFAADNKTIVVKNLENSEIVTFKLQEGLRLTFDKLSWSSDGSRIAFSAEKSESDGSISFQIFILNLMTLMVEDLGIEGRSPVWVYDY